MEEPSLVTAIRDPFRPFTLQSPDLAGLLSKLIQMPERNTNGFCSVLSPWPKLHHLHNEIHPLMAMISK